MSDIFEIIIVRHIAFLLSCVCVCVCVFVSEGVEEKVSFLKGFHFHFHFS